MIRRFAPMPWLAPQTIVVLLTLFSHIVIALGVPLPASRRFDTRESVAYPCRDRACGCLTAELCWKGDCCCFTLAEKVQWADAHGMAVPGAARHRVAEQPATPPHKSCCDKPNSSEPSACGDLPTRLHWVAGFAAQKCRGDRETPFGAEEPLTAPEAANGIVAEAFDTGRTPGSAAFAHLLPQSPAVPPPRLA